MKKLVPHVSVTTRQGKNIAQTVIKTRHWRGGAGGGGGDGDDRGGGPGGDSRPPGNYKFHSKNCVTCDKMEEGQTSFFSDKTGRKYQIKRHYTCQDSWVVYYIRCNLCKVGYCGQTTQKFCQRHLGHREEIRQGQKGMGEHFKGKHGEGLDLRSNNNIEVAMRTFEIVIIGSVEKGKKDSGKRLDQLEADFQHRLMCMDVHGGMNIRNETRRRGGKHPS